MDPWKVYAAAVEAAEPGASRHCAGAIYEDDVLVGYSHFRLGIRVTVARQAAPKWWAKA